MGEYAKRLHRKLAPKAGNLPTEELLHWDAKAEQLINWLQDHWSTWPKARTRPEGLPIPTVLYDLRQMAYWFGLFQRAIPGEQEAPP